MKKKLSGNEAIRQKLIAIANRQHAKHPQYKNYWDNWALVQARRDVKHRGVTILLKGEYTLMNPTRRSTDSFPPELNPEDFAVIYCYKGEWKGINCEIRKANIKVIL